jgi:hypothetical protein
MEVRLIRELRANDPEIGYNRWPKRELSCPGIQAMRHEFAGGQPP